MTKEQSSLRRRILSDRYNRIIFGSGRGDDVYVVGGYLRDLLLRRKCLDRDFVIGGSFEAVLSAIASDLGTKAVSIGGKGLFRIIVQKKVTLDFSAMRKEIHHDLTKRDFTINAMAWSPSTGVIDETCGIQDLARQTLRMISAANLREDPVRVIRAYRLAASLSFRMDSGTRRILKEFASLVSQQKRERITLEFFKLLNLSKPERALRLMQEDGVLERVIVNDNKILQDNLRALSTLLRNLNELPLKYRKLLPSDLSQNLSHLGFLRLSLLMRGLPENILALSTKVRKYLELIERGRGLYYKKGGVSSGEDLFDLFVVAREATPYFLVTNNLHAYLPEFDRYLRINRKALLSADRIGEITGLPNDERLGSMIAALKRARFTGVVRRNKDAIRFLQKNLPH